jgi:Fe-S cluster biogenesis protein NfuA
MRSRRWAARGDWGARATLVAAIVPLNCSSAELFAMAMAPTRRRALRALALVAVARGLVAPVARHAARAAPRRGPAPRRAEVASPFESSSTEASGAGGALDFSLENVDKVLDQVRPYLVADGGNVAVVSADPDSKDVILHLEGACGSCPSSTQTMKMGIERVLRERWADLGSVTRDDDPENRLLTVDEVERILEPIGNALVALGASVEVVACRDDVVEINFSGPENVRYGIELSLLDSPLITEVMWL